MAIDELRDFQGSLADAQAFYTAAQAQYQASLLGEYVIDGRTYRPPPPEKVRNELAYWSAQILRLKTIQPNAPDIGLMQTEFDGAPPLRSSFRAQT